MTNPPDQQNKDNRDSINVNNSGNFTARDITNITNYYGDDDNAPLPPTITIEEAAEQSGI